ncbi:MAG TPA: UDP-glucose/GDP-mannose dehydrogenase family protein [Gaiellaceae bacterium]|nr:UDP-glucose/GDP-mannose dehydrogenase family protein [Gaiellaceae bacterium]
MRVSIFGLGYVGTVCAACLARFGHEVVGVDLNEDKNAQISAGRSPIVEPGLEDLIGEAVEAGRLSATSDHEQAVAGSELSLICVGTPSRSNGSLDTSHVEHVAQTIGEALRGGEERHTVVVRSTLLPGSTLGVVRPALEAASGLRCGEEVGLAYNPEFLREGSAVADFHDPPYTLVGGLDDESAKTAARLYESIDAPLRLITIPEAEMAKYAANAFHAAKIVFANEIANFSHAAGVDGRRVMELLVQDARLNISPAYLRPGFAYGGSCLPKDVRALLYAARQSDVELPLLRSLPESNDLQLRRGFELVLAEPGKRVGVLGLSFKAGTDDLRESPVVQLVEALVGKGYEVRIYDGNVNLARLLGTNREYIESVVPHLADLMIDDARALLDSAETVVVGNDSPEFAGLIAGSRAAVIDLVGLALSDDQRESLGERYRGIAW